MNLKNNSLQELIATLKDGRGAAKVVEWHGKMDAVRLEELKQRRLNTKLQGQVRGSRNLSKVGHESRIFFNHFLWHVQP